MKLSLARGPRFAPRPLLFGLVAVTLLIYAAAARAGVYSEDGVALGGSDPVAYFTEGKPAAGSSDHSYDYDGVTWHFASAANRDAFAADPGKYAPQYGGFCAWAVSQGYTAKTDPDAWRIVDGKLYLNYNRSVQRRWEGDIPGNIAKADSNWPALDD